MSGRIFRAYFPLPKETDSKESKAALELYYEYKNEDITAKQVFDIVQALFSGYINAIPEKRKDRCYPWENIIRFQVGLDMTTPGVHRYLFRLAFLEHLAGKKEFFSGRTVEDKKTIDRIKSFRDYILQNTDLSRYVREQMTFLLCKEIYQKKQHDPMFESQFCDVYHSKESSYVGIYAGNAEEQKQLEKLDKAEWVKNNNFHRKLDKYAGKFLKKGNIKFLKQMEICSLCSEFIVKDHPAGESVADFEKRLMKKFPDNDWVWYKGGLSGYVNRNELYGLKNEFIKDLKTPATTVEMRTISQAPQEEPASSTTTSSNTTSTTTSTASAVGLPPSHSLLFPAPPRPSTSSTESSGTEMPSVARKKSGA